MIIEEIIDPETWADIGTITRQIIEQDTVKLHIKQEDEEEILIEFDRKYYYYNGRHVPTVFFEETYRRPSHENRQ